MVRHTASLRDSIVPLDPLPLRAARSGRG